MRIASLPTALLTKGILANALAGHPGPLILKLSELSSQKWTHLWQAQRANKGCYFECASCGGEYLVRRNPHTLDHYHLARHSDSKGWTDCCGVHSRLADKIPTLDEFVDGLFDLPFHSEEVLLRLVRKRMRAFNANPNLFLGADAGGADTNRKRRSPNSPLGFLMKLSEIAGHNRHWPERDYACGFRTIMPNLARHADDLNRRGLFPGYGSCLVFPECKADLARALQDAMTSVAARPQLRGRAILIGRLLELGAPQGEEGDTEVKLTGMVGMWIRVPKKLWSDAKRSFKEALLPGESEGIEFVVCVTVQEIEGRLTAEQITWSPINSLGMPLPAEFGYEHRALSQLIEHKIPFCKALHQRIRVGSKTMVVDTMLRSPAWPQGSPKAMILEVDPHQSARKKPSKRRRIQTCDQARTPAASYDESVDASVLSVIMAKYPGFLPPKA